MAREAIPRGSGALEPDREGSRPRAAPEVEHHRGVRPGHAVTIVVDHELIIVDHECAQSDVDRSTA